MNDCDEGKDRRRRSLPAGERQTLDLCVPDAFEIDEVALYVKSGNCRQQVLGSASQFLLMVPRFGFRVAVERVQTAISAAVGMRQQQHPPGSMQLHGPANLLQDKLAVGFQIRRYKTLHATGNLYVIRTCDPEVFEKPA